MLKLLNQIIGKAPLHLRETARLWGFGLANVPMLLFITPRVERIDREHVAVRVPLNRRSRNHLKSMYFGALAAGADCACGLLAVYLMEQDPRSAGGKVSLIFKDFHADFLKRAEGDVIFTCTQGAEIQRLIDEVIEHRDRRHLSVAVTATVPSISGNEPVARFTLTLSLKPKAS